MTLQVMNSRSKPTRALTTLVQDMDRQAVIEIVTGCDCRPWQAEIAGRGRL